MEETKEKGRKNTRQGDDSGPCESGTHPPDHPALVQNQLQHIGLCLSPWHVVTEEDLARALGRHPVTIKRAVERGELPPPVRLMGKPTWTGAAILKHLESRLEQAQESADVYKRQRAAFSKPSKNER
ncbi:MAG: helix-turn-helix domain-containing protein [Planctomycetes bacterium]|nr:helix-turn-helix domain-containing protein [Planctomycetota bacterium]